MYYNVNLVDVLNGNGPSPEIVLWLVHGLPQDSLTVALASGGRDHFGWDQKTYILADIYDAINLNSRASGNWAKGKAPKFPAYPRPKSGKKEPAKSKVTVKSLYAQMQRQYGR